MFTENKSDTQINKQYKISEILQEFSDEESALFNEIENKIALQNLKYKETIEDIFEKQIIKDFNAKTGEGKKLQEKREKRYQSDYKGLRTLAIEGFIRMANNGDLLMIKNKIDSFNKRNKCNIPYEIIFLALAESGRKANAKSRVAGGYWQFTKSSARLFGLDPNSRNDKNKSTDAALRHFKQNINIVNSRAERSGKTLSDDVKRKYAFWMYNGSPKLVGKGYRGNGSKYDDGIISNYFKYIENSESENYVPRILAIRATIKNSLPKLQNNTISDKPEVDDHKKTPADLAFEKYDDESDKLDSSTRLIRLSEIEKKYKKEQEIGLIGEIYLENCLNIINKEKAEIENEKDDIAEITQTGTFIFEGLDKKEKYKVYSYIIVRLGTPSVLKKKFIENFPDTKVEDLLVTDINGVQFKDEEKFQRNETVFIKSKNLEKEKVQEFENTGKKDSDGFTLFKYNIKKNDTIYGIQKRFADQNKGSEDKYIQSGKIIREDGTDAINIKPGESVYLKATKETKTIEEFEDIERYNSEGYKILRYTVKPKDTLYEISRKFNSRNLKSGNKYKEVSYKNIVNISGDIIENIKEGDKLYVKAIENN